MRKRRFMVMFLMSLLLLSIGKVWGTHTAYRPIMRYAYTKGFGEGYWKACSNIVRGRAYTDEKMKKEKDILLRKDEFETLAERYGVQATEMLYMWEANLPLMAEEKRFLDWDIYYLGHYITSKVAHEDYQITFKIGKWWFLSHFVKIKDVLKEVPEYIEENPKK